MALSAITTSSAQDKIGRLTERIANLTAKGADQATLDTARQNLADWQRRLQMTYLRKAELQGAAGQVRAQYGLNEAMLNQQIGQAQVGQEGDLLTSERARMQGLRDLEGTYGGADMLRSGVYQRQVALSEEDRALERANIIRQYNAEIQGLQAQVMAGRDARSADVAAARAQIQAAYALAMLG